MSKTFTTPLNPQLQKILLKVEMMGDLPTLSEVVNTIQRMSEDANTSLVDLANVILEDPALSSKVLRLINSSVYAQFSGRISTVTRAIVLLGFSTVKELALGVRIMQTVNRLGNQQHLKNYWTLSLASAICTRELALRTGYDNPEEAFVAGLLQNVGQVILEQCFPEDYCKVLDHTPEKGRLAAERMFLKTDHQEVGGVLAQYWNFPEPLVNALRYHHRVGTKHTDSHGCKIVDLVFVGHLIASYVIEPVVGGTPPEHTSLQSAVTHVLQLDKHHVQEMVAMLPGRLTELAQSFEIELAIPEVLFPEDKTVLKMADLDGASQRKLDEREMLLEISQAMVQGFQFESLIQLILECAFRSAGFERIVLFLQESGSDTMEGYLGFGLNPSVKISKLTIPIHQKGNHLLEQLNEGKTLHLRRRGDSDLLPFQVRTALDLRDFVIAPIALKGKMHGVLLADNQQSKTIITADAVRALTILANQAAVAMVLHSRGLDRNGNY